MDKHESKVARGEEALRVLNSQVFNEAFDNVRQAYLKTWESLQTADSDEARDIHRRIKCLADVKKALEYHVSTGKLAEKELTARERASKAVKNMLNPFANSARNR